MKIYFLIILVLLVACTKSSANEFGRPLVLTGTAVDKKYLTPSGEQSQSVAIALQYPIFVNGMAKPITNVELILSEKDLMNWADKHGKIISITCSLEASSLWGYPNAACSPTHIVVGP